MGRKSKLTEGQWETIGRRMLEGDAIRALAREYGVSEAAIRARKSAQVAEIKDVANQVVAAEMAVRRLPETSQLTVRTYVQRAMDVGETMLVVAENQSKTALRMSAIGNTSALKVDDVDPDPEALKIVAMCNRLVNDAATVPMALLTASKGIVVDNQTDRADADIVIPSDPVEASRAYQRLMSRH